MTTYYYVQPTDTLFVRGNLAFGDAGEHGASLMPPPPSLFAGAFRSALLGRDAGEMSAFLAQGRCNDARLDACLGTPENPGAFCISWLSLAGRVTEKTMPEAVFQLPADLLRLESGFAPLQPRTPGEFVASAGELPLRATLISAKQEKPKSGYSLRQAGFARHRQGQLPETAHEIEARHLYKRDPRLGIGLNAESRSVEEGLIYTTEGFSFSPASSTEIPRPFASTGFLVGIEGADGLLPEAGLLRLGGDGRSAQYRRVDFQPPRVEGVPGASNRFRLILQTPALFAQGWLPDGVNREGGDCLLRGPGFSARLVCAALGRREIISGWDLFNWKPKPAEAAVPAGSVYWFEDFQGDAGKLAEWVAGGLWGENPDLQRRAEGYNRAGLAIWN
ncbi:MAG: type III-B CRISPR module-associated Cmr3 family protein [Pseudomonadota bacterium]|nr:type III-B CRISPR module-associated Cmr3 family protein [Pseudomonadota bacterium]